MGSGDDTWQPGRIGPFADDAAITLAEQTPLEVRFAARTPYDAISASARRCPDKAATLFLPNGLAGDTPESTTYAQLLDGLVRAANLFRSMGVGSTDVVAVLLPNVPEFHAVIWGATTAGVAFPINYLLEPAHIAQLIRTSGARVLVTVAPAFDAEIWNRAEAARRMVDTLDVVVAVRGSAPGAIDYAAALQTVLGESLTFLPEKEFDDVTVLVNTGGSTGHPKIACQTNRNLLFEAWVLGAIRERRQAECSICGGPLFHAAGLIITGLMPLFWGSTILMLSPYGYRAKGVIGDLWNIVVKYNVTHATLVPTILTVLAGLPFKPVPSTLKSIGCGAAPLPQPLHDKFLKLTGLPVSQGYGLTEAGCAVTTTQHSETPFGSIGRRLPYVQVRIVILDENGNELRDAADGEYGVIAVRGPNVFAGYVGERNGKATWLQGGWLNTGDLGYRDSDGFYWLIGRAKDIIVRSGHNIDPRVIEDALLRLDGIRDAAAVGMPDAYAGELPVAFVVADPIAALTADDILHKVGLSIPERAAIPKRIILTDGLPKTRVDKIDKGRLRATAARLAMVEALTSAGIGTDHYTIADEAGGGMRFVVRTTSAAHGDLGMRIKAALDPLGVPVTVV